MVIKNIVLAEDLREEHNYGEYEVATPREDWPQHSDYINGEQYEHLLDELQGELLSRVRNKFEDGMLHALTLCSRMIGDPAFIQRAFNTYDASLKPHTAEVEVA